MNELMNKREKERESYEWNLGIYDTRINEWIIEWKRGKRMNNIMKVIKYLNEWMNEPGSEWMKARKTRKRINKRMKSKYIGYLSESNCEWMAEWVNEWLSEWMNESKEDRKTNEEKYDYKRVKMKERKWIMKTELVNEWMWERQGNEWIREWTLST